jgi:hypothetical protein
MPALKGKDRVYVRQGDTVRKGLKKKKKKKAYFQPSGVVTNLHHKTQDCHDSAQPYFYFYISNSYGPLPMVICIL